MLEEESAELEARRKGLEESQEAGKQDLDAAREELRLAANRLEGEKEQLKTAWKVKVFACYVYRVLCTCEIKRQHKTRYVAQ